MQLPRTVYEALPAAYVAGGIVLCAGASRASAGAIAECAFVAGAAGIVYGLVLWLRRRSYRDEAARYDSHSLDDIRPDVGAGVRRPD